MAALSESQSKPRKGKKVLPDYIQDAAECNPPNCGDVCIVKDEDFE
jgi:hypothetical protein